MPSYVLTISNKGRPYPFDNPLRLLLGPASLGLLSTSGSRSHGIFFDLDVHTLVFFFLLLFYRPHKFKTTNITIQKK
jgi:hypothetical protein